MRYNKLEVEYKYELYSQQKDSEKKSGLQRAQNYQRIIELKADEQIQLITAKGVEYFSGAKKGN